MQTYKLAPNCPTFINFAILLLKGLITEPLAIPRLFLLLHIEINEDPLNENKQRLFIRSLPEHGSQPWESATGVDHCHVLLGGTERFLVDRGEGFEGTPTEAVGTWQLGWLSRRGASLCLVRGAYLTLSVWF